MKKLFFSLLLLSGSCALFAQEKPNNIPPAIRQSIQSDYASTDSIKWQRSGNDWWDVSYMKNQQTVNKSCNIEGQCKDVALPVLENNIPSDLIEKMTAKYGSAIYDITKIKGSDGQNEYVVRVLQNGEIITERISESQLLGTS